MELLACFGMVLTLILWMGVGNKSVNTHLDIIAYGLWPNFAIARPVVEFHY